MNKVKQANRFILFIFIFNIFGAQLYYGITEKYPDFRNFYTDIITSQIILVLIPTIIFLAISKVNIKKLLRFHSITWFEFLTLFAFSIFIRPLIALINAISLLFAENTSQTIMDEVMNIPLILGLLLVGLLPAFTEELLTRGVLYHSYRKQSMLTAALVSSLLFGILHMNINQSMYAIVIGFIFVLLIEATDSILSAIYVHLLINGSSVLLSYWLTNSSLHKFIEESSTAIESNPLEAVVSTIIPAIIFTPIAFYFFYILAKYNDRLDIIKSIFKKQPKENIDINQPIMTWHIYVCILIFIQYNILVYILK